MSEERAAEVVYAAGVLPGDVLLEPCPALLKAGAFRLPCTRWALRKLAPSTHLYLLPADSITAPNYSQFIQPDSQFEQSFDHFRLSHSPSGLDPESLSAPGTKTAKNVPGSQIFDLPGTKTGSGVPGDQSGNQVVDLPGAKTSQIAPGNENYDSPGAYPGQIALGSFYFKGWRVTEVLPFGAAAFKALRKRYPRADVTARNLPLGSAELQKRLGVASGGTVHIFGCRLADGSSVLLITEPA